jgi:hypothetical protein
LKELSITKCEQQNVIYILEEVLLWWDGGVCSTGCKEVRG